MKNVIIRSLSGIVYVALIVGSIIAGETCFFVLTSLLMLLGLLEYNKMAATGVNASDADVFPFYNFIDLVGAGGIFALVPCCAHYNSYIAVLPVIAGYFIVRAVAGLYDKRPTAYREVAKSLLGVIYLALPLMLLNQLYTSAEGCEWLVLAMFIMIWLNDTGAFCFGSLLGRHKLFERLSPKKSWEGFWGGMLCCVGFGVACSYLMSVPCFTMVSWVVMGVLVSVFSTWGDLFESMLKRTVKVKDSGHLIPGHGGILDRIDSLLFVAPVTYILYLVVTN